MQQRKDVQHVFLVGAAIIIGTTNRSENRRDTIIGILGRNKREKDVTTEKNSNRLIIAMLGHKHVPAQGEGGVEVVVEELSTRLTALGHQVTCFNRSNHHIGGKEFDGEERKGYKGVRLKTVPTIKRKGLAAVTSSFFASLFAAFGNYDVVHIHAEGPAVFCWLPKLFGKRVVVTVHGDAQIISRKNMGLKVA